MNPDQIDVRSRTLEPSACVGDAWTRIGPNYWTLFVINIIAGLIILLLSMIPLAGIIIVPIVSGPLMAGVQKVYIDVSDGGFADIGSMFDGFRRMVPNVLVALVIASPMILLQGAQLLALIPQTTIETVANQAPGTMQGLAIVYISIAIAATLAYYAIVFCTYFAHMLIMDHDLDAISAIKLSTRGVIGNIGRMILFILLMILLWIAGFLAFCIGLLFMIPVVMLSTANAYRHIFPKTALEPAEYNPPAPDQYGDMFGQMS